MKKSIISLVIGIISVLVLSCFINVSFAVVLPQLNPIVPFNPAKTVPCNMTAVLLEPKDPILEKLPSPTDLTNNTAIQMLNSGSPNTPVLVGNWGTTINCGHNGNNYQIWGVNVKEYINKNLELGSTSTYKTLYAPTIRAPDPCPLEAVTIYSRWSGDLSTNFRAFNVWDFHIGTWGRTEIKFSDLESQHYTNTDGWGEYYEECTFGNSTGWGVYLYNFYTTFWDQKYFIYQQYGTYGNGWCMYEWHSNSESPPTTSGIKSDALIVDNTWGSGWVPCTSSFATLLNNPSGWLDFNNPVMDTQYSKWHVGN